MCSKVVPPSSVMEAIVLRCHVVDDETGNLSWQGRADFYLRCILSSLPWEELAFLRNLVLQQVPDEIERVMVGIEAYLSIRKRTYYIGVSVFEFDDESVKARNEKALPGAFPAVVAGAVRALFERMVDLDIECRMRLILWFSHHLDKSFRSLCTCIINRIVQGGKPASHKIQTNGSEDRLFGVEKVDIMDHPQVKATKKVVQDGINALSSAPLSTQSVKVAAKVGLAAAAMKAKLFADHEEREIQRMAACIINHQLKRLELKLKQFAEVETLLMKERKQV
ncbi:hypothetical protein C5167_002542 [Papaver somniferum]|uniref:SMARCC C-terminal domain-containing protein n=1 Tax=Papaver somniferum TaxID=3469 RepID=A0A4Y7L150_PAPSO|nr:hypothetical protein C5167_002542 [Papaver somniferum]